MQLRRLQIWNFRTFETLDWNPSPRLNVLIGPGDAGKSTILAGIHLLLAPYPGVTCSEFDFHNRHRERGFEIRGVLAGADLETVFEGLIPPLWGWRDGNLDEVPDETMGAEPVVVCRVRASPDFEIEHALLEPSGDTRPFSLRVRRRIYGGQLADQADPSRELRTAQGTLLTRHLGSTEGLRASLSAALQQASDGLRLNEELTEAVRNVEAQLQARQLAGEISLGLVPQRGNSLLGLAALMSDVAGTPLPLSASGSGTSRLALLTLAAALAGEDPILTIDELEQGLEPYRQRRAVAIVEEVAGEQGQAFVTTHAVPVLGSVSRRLDETVGVHRVGSGDVLPIAGRLPKRLLEADAEAYFARLPIICEGQTEKEFVGRWLSTELGGPLEDFGIRPVAEPTTSGNRAAIDLTKGLLDLGLDVAAFLDNEQENAGRRADLQRRTLVFVWNGEGVRNIEEAVARWLPLSRVGTLFAAGAAAKGVQESVLIADVWQRAGGMSERPRDAAALTEVLDELTLRNTVSASMQEYGKGWFKMSGGGVQLAEMLLRDGMPAPMQTQLGPFAAAVRTMVD